MRVSPESFHRPVKFWPARALLVLSILVIAAILMAPSPLVSVANATTQPSTVMPPCTRRVTVNSNPCGAMIYIDGIQVGRTPMSFPMPSGGYTLVLLAPGHEAYGQRIQVPQDAPLQIDAKLVPER
ncbi:MAG TPA: PEGA domain-containing protein [Candidatus Solibacter sp.]|nr:PEGA domain-containing protein [Candidatus Solibacter sp.]